MRKLPLRLFLLAHPQSDSGNLLAQELMRRFVDLPASGGLRIPVFLTPKNEKGLPPEWEGADGIGLVASDHTLVVVLADARMVRRVASGTGAEWQNFLTEGTKLAPVGTSPHHVFGVAIAKASEPGDRDNVDVFALGEARHMLGVQKEPGCRLADEHHGEYAKRIASWLQSVADEIALQIAVRAIALLEKGAVSETGNVIQKAPVRIFLSHAKADLMSNESDAVRSVENEIKEMPIDAWFDAANIPPGAEFEARIKEGVADSTILVAFLTDRYASRLWCQREVLVAKQLGVPILVVDALAEGEPRNFPYLGNLPTIHWSGADRKTEARRIVGRAVREALKLKHTRACLQKCADPGEIVVASAPEALTMAWHDAAAAGQDETFLYPDPPLARSEIEIVQKFRPSATFTTPLSKIACAKRLSGIDRIGVSTSISNDKDRFGLSPLHEESIFDEIHGYLLLAGLQIGYGGALKADFVKGTNFTLRLFELVRSYAPIAENAGGQKLRPVVNFAPWPLRLMYGESELNLFGEIAELIECDRPSRLEIPEEDSELFPPGSVIPALPETPERRLAWARGLTAMRWQMTHETGARLVVGGTLAGFKGLYPGVLEEAWMSIVSNKPVFLVGGFGGAARAAIDLLEGHNRPEVTTAGLSQTIPHFQAVLDLTRVRGIPMINPGGAFGIESAERDRVMPLPDKIVEDLKTAGATGLSAALNNGLTENENRELFRSSDGTRIAELVLNGLSRLV